MSNRYDKHYAVPCPGSGQRINAFPGEDVCPECQRWVRVRQDSTIGKHPARKEKTV